MAARLVPLLIPILLAGCAASPGVDARANAPAEATTPPPMSMNAPDPLMDVAIGGAWRSPENAARDRYRNPRETLTFFGIQTGQTVVEITPGGGWYAEILAPWLRTGYVAAVVDPEALAEDRRDYYARSKASLERLFASNPEQFGDARVVGYDPAAPVFGPAGSADAVVTFRNVHNWLGADQAEGMFQGFFEVLKPGGVLGVIDHRAADADAYGDGYVGQDRMIALAEGAGFQLDASSEINANPADTRDHPNGVWTLPPTNRHDEADAAKYAEIGESDRMTLRFVKPE